MNNCASLAGQEAWQARSSSGNLAGEAEYEIG
jgi:hypothetical protein